MNDELRKGYEDLRRDIIEIRRIAESILKKDTVTEEVAEPNKSNYEYASIWTIWQMEGTEWPDSKYETENYLTEKRTAEVRGDSWRDLHWNEERKHR